MNKHYENFEQNNFIPKDRKALERDFFEECERTKRELKEAQLQLKLDIQQLNQK